jgi:hypothetical protein
MAQLLERLVLELFPVEFIPQGPSQRLRTQLLVKVLVLVSHTPKPMLYLHLLLLLEL